MADNQTLSFSDLVGLVIDSVKAVEAAFPPGSGKQKFDAVFAQIMAYAPVVTVGATVVEKLLPFMINTTVAVFNKIGTFLKSAAPTA